MLVGESPSSESEWSLGSSTSHSPGERESCSKHFVDFLTFVCAEYNYSTTNCMAMQNHELMWPTLQRKTELLEYPAAQRTSSIVSGQEGFQEQTVCARNTNPFCIDAELFLKEMDVYLS